ncbi:MAG: histidinol dehydrogenase [Flavobacteriaceae bacterium]|jgi:histidinol dehydrogenase
MKRYNLPKKENWSAICSRPVFEQASLTDRVKAILDNVKSKGDQAIYDYTEKFDGAQLDELIVSENEIQNASNNVSQELKLAIQSAKRNIEKFHSSQKDKVEIIETTEGVACWRKSVAIEKVGLYIPGGSAPLFSTVLMLGIPARQAGCNEIVLCTPPDQNGAINPAILYTAELVGVTKIFKIGGAQAIAAMSFGTVSVPQVYKIFGPGNQFVTKAKELVQQEGIAIDMPAGPSEVLVIADSSCEPAFVAADLLSQAEHGADSQVILLSDDAQVLDRTDEEVRLQLDQLPRKETAQKALANSKSILCSSINECLSLSNYYAPEHLIIASQNADTYVDQVINAGSVFLGNYSCESAGDYASGTNHTLPTNGYAKSYSGVSLDSFVRKITFQKLSEKGIQNIGPAIELMAEAEALFAHKNAVTLRLNSLKDV